MTRWHARWLLAAFLLTTGFFVAVTFSPLKSGFADAASRGPCDIELYRAEADRIRSGESYYDAVESELHARGYPTRSVLNWRTPLPVWLIGILPNASLAKGILGILSLAFICLSFSLLAEQAGLAPAMLATLLATGALLPCVLGDLFVMSELWSGMLLAISVACLGLERRRAGIAAGIGALFLRELAAPYCVLCLVLALADRRFREATLWCTGLVAYALFYALHAWQVVPRISADDLAHADGWLRFGGAGFLISTAQMNAYLLLLPQWVTAIYLGCVLLGCAAWNTSAGRLIALTTAGYAVGFSIAGHDFNQYWGSLTAPLFCLSACRAPWAIWQLITDAAPLVALKQECAQHQS